MMFSLDKYSDPMSKAEVAEVLRCKPGTVPRITGLKKTFLLNGRKGFGYRKQDVIDYINSRVEREEVIRDASNEKERHRKMGIPSLLSWDELQKARLGYQR
jgi:hypothetical protein